MLAVCPANSLFLNRLSPGIAIGFENGGGQNKRARSIFRVQSALIQFSVCNKGGTPDM